MNIKVKKLKFIRNILISVIALLSVAFIINIAPGYKRDRLSDMINLVIGDENVTEKLKKPILKDNEENIFLSQEDILEYFDSKIEFNKENSTIIATLNSTNAEINENNYSISNIICSNNTVYIPINEVKKIYDIEVIYNPNNNVVIIDKLNEGMIKAEVDTETKIRFKPRALSKTIGELKIGEIVSAFYTTSKGWRLIRTENGTVGYVKANVFSDEYIVRHDVNKKMERVKVNISVYNTIQL